MTATEEQITATVDEFTGALDPSAVEEAAARLDLPVDDLLMRVVKETKTRIESEGETAQA